WSSAIAAPWSARPSRRCWRRADPRIRGIFKPSWLGYGQGPDRKGNAMIIHHSDARALPLAVDLLSRQDLVAVPTETVYGLAGLSTSPEAIAKIYAAKNRPQGNPLISHVADIAMAERYAVFDPVSRRLAEAFWPGPLTLILPLRDGKGIDRSSTAGRELVALRAPKGFAH